MKGTLEQLPQLYEAKFAQSQKNPTRVPLGKYSYTLQDANEPLINLILSTFVDIFEYFMFCFAYFTTIHKEAMKVGCPSHLFRVTDFL